MKTSVCFYFQVHQPFRLKTNYHFFNIGPDHDYEDYPANRDILKKIATNCYLPTNKILLNLLKKHKGDFKISFSISGCALEQFELFAPEVLESFIELVNTGHVELLCETYYHSLAFIKSRTEFKEQVIQHRQKIEAIFGVTPTTFRNTELIFNNDLAHEVEQMGFKTILAEGVDRILGWRSPNYVYRPNIDGDIKLLLKNYKLSDDVAFRFSNKEWSEYPLTVEKYSKWIHQVAGCGDTVNLFMDYETFGEHQWEGTGILKFLNQLPEHILSHPDFIFQTPSEVASSYPVRDVIDVQQFTSWADQNRDLSAWFGNPLQDSAADLAYSLEKPIKDSKDPDLIHTWRKLLTSDHNYYTCTKLSGIGDGDGDVHKYFSPYDTPYDAYISYVNVLNDLKHTLDERYSEN